MVSPNPINTSPADTMRDRHRAMLSSVAVEWSSFALNLVGALMANSLTLWTNTLRVSLDSLATLFAYIVTRRMAQGNSHQFDYGLGKWENLSALVNAVVMVVALVIIVFHAIMRFINPTTVTGAGFGLSVLLFFSIVNFWLLTRFWRLRCADSSPVVEAQFILYRNASVASILSLMAVAVSFFAGKFQWAAWFDPVGALFLSGVIFYGILTLFQRSLPALLDKTLEESLQLRILKALAERFEDYDQIHGVRTRRSGKRIFVELFLEFDAELRVKEMLAHAGRLKSLVEGLIPDAEVWVIPCGHTEADMLPKEVKGK